MSGTFAEGYAQGFAAGSSAASVAKAVVAPLPKPAEAPAASVAPTVEPDAEQLVIDFEQGGKCALVPYRDPLGIPTIAYGSIWDWRTSPTSRVTMATPPVTEAMAREWLGREMVFVMNTINNEVKVPLTHGEMAALEDLLYNEGSTMLQTSAILKCLNAKDYAGACKHLADWDMGGGQKLAGLVRRRAAEQAEWNKGN